MATSGSDWWRTAVIYQVYPRSFADSDGNGVGDLPGIVERLDDVAALGVDAVWLSPFYPSPQADAGYDVADYCDVDKLFGTLADFDRLLSTAHNLGLRVIIDLVPNHTSSAHPWFQAALAGAPGSAARERYVFRDTPTDWQSVFGGSAWTSVPDGQWYLHLFDSAQPDLNWECPDVAAMFLSVLRFWLDRGVDGFRVDVSHALVKDSRFPSFPGDPLSVQAKAAAPYWDQEGVHAIFRSWRSVLDGYSEADPSRPRILCAEANVAVPRAARYVRADEMHQAFNFPYLNAPWDATALRSVIEESLAAYGAVGAPTTWVLSNHDSVRHASRLGYPVDAPAGQGIGADDPQPDEQLGLRRARAATLLMLALPGTAYLYQGEELGLPESTRMPDQARRDPSWLRTRTERGRDGSRVPLPWVADAPGYGFSTAAETWLPQPDAYRAYSRDLQRTDPSSTLRMYQRALGLRREYGLGAAPLQWESAAGNAVLDFRCGRVRVWCNLGDRAVSLPSDAELLLDSRAADGAMTSQLEPDCCVWLLA